MKPNLGESLWSQEATQETGQQTGAPEGAMEEKQEWPREIVEGNWVSWEKYIVTFWAKSGRAVRQSPVRAHRVRYGSWLRSQAAD
ncbi:hypothetical protein MG293_010110 [Ovis ammon polii]|uniref:Uncharacterized protein n=1 Tax=Ovis ammon polii TaxID=230172 RepID=A0AAD4U8W0_OVIAM|nr:hypothetical protein MG293_010110 [Ovis ammon polii]